MPRRAVCRVHGAALVCPACLGAKGGRVRSPAKRPRSRANAVKATAQRLALRGSRARDGAGVKSALEAMRAPA